MLKKFTLMGDLGYHRKYFCKYLDNGYIEVNRLRLIGGGDQIQTLLGLTNPYKIFDASFNELIMVKNAFCKACTNWA